MQQLLPASACSFKWQVDCSHVNGKKALLCKICDAPEILNFKRTAVARRPTATLRRMTASSCGICAFVQYASSHQHDSTMCMLPLTTLGCCAAYHGYRRDRRNLAERSSAMDASCASGEGGSSSCHIRCDPILRIFASDASAREVDEMSDVGVF